MINGFICINKPASISSNKVLGILKYNLRKIGINEKIGHMGTLDPIATGVLPVCMGRATRLFDYSLDKIKVYEATFLFGAASESLDTDTDVTIDESFCMPSTDMILWALERQIGEIDQVPPSFSAKSINGTRAYTLARKGENVELTPKKVTIYDIKLLEQSDNEIRVQIMCGGGTYVRAIGRDVAVSLGTTAVMTKLIRTASGKFTLQDSVALSEIEKDPSIFLKKFLPIDFFLSDYPVCSVTEEEKRLLLNGRRLSKEKVGSSYYTVKQNDEIIGIGMFDDDGKLFVKTWLL